MGVAWVVLIADSHPRQVGSAWRQEGRPHRGPLPLYQRPCVLWVKWREMVRCTLAQRSLNRPWEPLVKMDSPRQHLCKTWVSQQKHPVLGVELSTCKAWVPVLSIPKYLGGFFHSRNFPPLLSSPSWICEKCICSICKKVCLFPDVIYIYMHAAAF